MQIFLMTAGTLAAMTFIMGPLNFLADKSGILVAIWLIGPMLTVAAIVGYAVDHQLKSETFSLRTQDWDCSSTYQIRQFTGKVWITESRCSQYSRVSQ